MDMKALNRAIAIAGGVGDLAEAVGVTVNAIYNWRGRGSVGEAQCPDIERACKGIVTCEELRPDIRWQRVPDASWPHPDGRPCIDVAKPVTA